MALPVQPHTRRAPAVPANLHVLRHAIAVRAWVLHVGVGGSLRMARERPRWPAARRSRTIRSRRNVRPGHINDRTRRVPLCLLVSSHAGLVRAGCARRIAKLATLPNALCFAASPGLLANGAIEKASKRSWVVGRPTMLTGGVLKSHKPRGRQAREHVDLETSNRPERVGNQASSRACKRAGEASGQTVQTKHQA